MNDPIFPAIVIVAYDRPKSLERLLEMLSNACYPDGDTTHLFISIDGGGSVEVKNVADSWNWKFGKKEVRVLNENVGLREHVLQCGDLVNEYGSIVMLEDDVGVSRMFYQYAMQAIDRFDRFEQIAGISLYKHLINVNCGARFEPMDKGYGWFCMQFAQSWGQVWTLKQWKGFRKWYADTAKLNKLIDIPAAVENWPESSWLKYYIKYLVDTDKYFIYPSHSLSTNFNDTGTNVSHANNNFQVPLSEALPELSESPIDEAIKYDVYFEMKESSLRSIIGDIPDDRIIIDLYGIRPIGNLEKDRLILTVRGCSKVEKSWGLRLRPREMNLVCSLKGTEIKLAKIRHVDQHRSLSSLSEYEYHPFPITGKKMLRLYYQKFKKRCGLS